MIYLLTEIGLTPCGSSTVHIYTQTIHRTVQLTILFARLYGTRTQSGVVLIQTYLLTAIGLTHGGSSTAHIYTQPVHRTIQLTTLVGRLSGIPTQSGQTKINDKLTA